jgi:hypothetical protein
MDVHSGRNFGSTEVRAIAFLLEYATGAKAKAEHKQTKKLKPVFH